MISIPRGISSRTSINSSLITMTYLQNSFRRKSLGNLRSRREAGDDVQVNDMLCFGENDADKGVLTLTETESRHFHVFARSYALNTPAITRSPTSALLVPW